MIDLKPCPFCGGNAEFVRNNMNSCYVQCLSCFIIGNNTALKADAIKAWNIREHDNSLRFEFGKTYKHTSGNTMTIIGSLKTHIYGWAFVAELPDGTLKPVGYTDDGYAQNWSEEK